MRKFVFTCLMSLGAFTISAQESAGAIDLQGNEMYGVGEPIVVHAEYLTDPDGSGPAIANYQWELRPVDADGNIGDIIYSETHEGDPTGDFTFPQEITGQLLAESAYDVFLTANSADGIAIGTGVVKFTLSDFTLNADNEICCGTDITAMLGYTGQVMVAGVTYHFSLTRCDAAGNSNWPLSYYVSNEIPYAPGQIFVPNSGLPWQTGVQCDSYYRLDVTFSNGTYGMHPVTRSKVIYVTSFKMSANSTYCCGANVTAKATTCPNINVNITNPYHQWQFIPCNAQGNPTGSPVYTTQPIAGINGNTDAIWGGALTCGQYYLLTCLYNNGPTGTVATRNKVIYISPSVQPSISMTSNSCGVASFTATPAGPYTYTWSAYNNNTLYTGQQTQNTNTFVVGPGIFNSAKVVVTSQAGCTGQTQLGGVGNTNPNYTGDFSISFVSIDQSYYYIKINRNGNYPTTGLNDAFEVADFYGNAPLAWNLCWSPMSAGWGANIYLFGYNGNYFTYTNNCSPATYGYPNGRFDKSRTYWIEHYIYGNGCSRIVDHYFSWSNGVWRMSGENDGSEITTEQDASFGVFPNPNNGSFTILFPEITDNAQGELYNLMGERVDAFTFSGDKYEYTPAEKLAPGMYMIRVTNNGTVSTKKIIVQ
jgi:hypothetical protein